jgi:tetratricopeptide (TPR) repeat protein
MKRYWLVGLFLMVLMQGCSKSPQEKVFELFQKGLRQLERYDYEAAQATFEEIGQIDPGSPLGYYGTGLVYERQMRIYDALHVYMALTNTKPSYASPYESLWRVLTWLKQWDDATSAAVEYARLLPNNPSAQRTLAEALMNIGQYGRARQELNKAIELGGDQTVINVGIARAYALEHKNDSASVLFEKAVSRSPQSPDFYAEAAAYYEAVGLVDSAVTMGRLAFEKDDYDFHLGLNQFYRALEHDYFYEARRVIERLREAGAPEPTLKGLEIFYYLAVGHETKARHASDSLSTYFPLSISTLIYDMTVRAGNLGDMLTGTQNIAAIKQLMKRNNYDQEYQGYMRYLLAVLFSGFYQDPVAIPVLQDVPGKYANRLDYKLNNLLVELRTGQQKKFDKNMELLIQFHSTQPDWLTGLADIYADRGVKKYDTADSYYRRALQYDQWYRPAFEHLVNMYHRLNKPQKALQVFADYPYFEQQYPALSLLKAYCLVESGSIPAGVRLFKDNFVHVRGNLTEFREMASLLWKKNALPERESLYRMLPEINGDIPDALVLAAEFECDQGDFEKAQSLAEKAAAIEPEYIPASVQKARALYGMGKRDEAIEIFERNLVQDRFDISNNYYYSRILAFDKSDSNKAANLARRALFDAPGDLKVWMNLCYVYYQIGRYDLARGEAIRAMNKYGYEPEPYYWAGMAMFMEGNKEARENLEAAIDLGLKGELLKSARETLDKM